MLQEPLSLWSLELYYPRCFACTPALYVSDSRTMERLGQRLGQTCHFTSIIWCLQLHFNWFVMYTILVWIKITRLPPRPLWRIDSFWQTALINWWLPEPCVGKDYGVPGASAQSCAVNAQRCLSEPVRVTERWSICLKPVPSSWSTRKFKGMNTCGSVCHHPAPIWWSLKGEPL